MPFPCHALVRHILNPISIQCVYFNFVCLASIRTLRENNENKDSSGFIILLYGPKWRYREMKVSVHVSADKSLCLCESGDSAFVSHITSQNPIRRVTQRFTEIKGTLRQLMDE